MSYVIKKNYIAAIKCRVVDNVRKIRNNRFDFIFYFLVKTVSY